jgi:hypothetical protein
MRWIKKGVIFAAANQYDWMAHHACVPVADKVNDKVLRVYFRPARSGRDEREPRLSTSMPITPRT